MTRLVEGDVTLAQARSLTWAHRNPRAREHLAVRRAASSSTTRQCVDAAEFDGYVRDFVEARRRRRRRPACRVPPPGSQLSHVKVGTGFHGDYSCGAAQGVIIDKVLKAFEQREFDADCAEAKARVGADYSANDLTRTRQQRRIDALVAICQTAASATPGSSSPSRW